ncbi:MAG TPA: PcfJ domain-containing protein, partial [Tepidisphaeraceae bacterium]|nr:PcfJ domain-containing protein [Tepidisphaeraceae bacterium]
MDLNRTYRCAALEVRRKRELGARRADEVMRRAREQSRDPRKKIDAALSGEPNEHLTAPIARRVRQLASRASTARRDAFRALVDVVARKSDEMLTTERYVVALWRLAERSSIAIRNANDWKPSSHNLAKQFASLAAHLYARYPMPAFFESAWLSDHDESSRWRLWYIQVAQGASLRDVIPNDITLTKRMAHHTMLAPNDLDVSQAIRWGQMIALGGSKRHAREVVNARVGAFARLSCGQIEAFWMSVIQFIANNPMLDPTQIGPIADYLFQRRFVSEPDRIVEGQFVRGQIPEPNLSMKGRSVESLMRQMREWHAQLARIPKRGAMNFAWQPSGIPEMERIEGTSPNQTIVRVVELLTSGDLFEEGRKLHHCVASYAHSCMARRVSIFSLRVDQGKGVERLITLEVQLSNRT